MTTTRRRKFDAKDEDPDVKLFPSPPRQSTEVQFGLRRHLTLQAKTFKTSNSEAVSPLGGLGKGKAKQHVAVEVIPREWIPAEGREGSGYWLEETTFRSFIELRCTPTFSSSSMNISVRLPVLPTLRSG